MISAEIAGSFADIGKIDDAVNNKSDLFFRENESSPHVSGFT